MYQQNNTSFYSDSGGKASSYDKSTLSLIVTIILAVFIVVTILGNSLVCLAFYRQPRFWRVSYYPILSLAIADLLCGTLAMPAYIAKKHVADGGWQEGVTCDVFRFTYFFTEYASIMSLTAISMERFIAIKMPVKHRTWLTKRKMTIALVMSWCEAAVVSALPFFWKKRSENEPCRYNPTNEWSMMVILGNVFFPFLIMLCCHVYTVSQALHRRRTKNVVAAAFRAPDGEKAKVLRRERDLTCALSIVVGAFIFCWGPSSFYYFFEMVCPQCYGKAFKPIKPIFNATVKLMTFGNSCLNPVIYCWLNRSLRDAFYQTLCGRPSWQNKIASVGMQLSTNGVQMER